MTISTELQRHIQEWILNLERQGVQITEEEAMRLWDTYETDKEDVQFHKTLMYWRDNVEGITMGDKSAIRYGKHYSERPSNKNVISYKKNRFGVFEKCRQGKRIK